MAAISKRMVFENMCMTSVVSTRMICENMCMRFITPKDF